MEALLYPSKGYSEETLERLLDDSREFVVPSLEKNSLYGCNSQKIEN